MSVALQTSLLNTQLNDITTAAGTLCKLRVYTGPRPATAAAITTQTLLAELICNATFAPGAAGGVLTLNAISADTSANNSGLAQWFRIVQTDGTTFVMDGNVGTVGSDLNFNSVDFLAGQNVSVSSFTITNPNG
jgi:hypothetical protein